MPDVDVKAPVVAYRGTEEFVFVSYAHKDGSAVFPDITYLHEQGYRIWYDEGIDPGNEWPEKVAKALAGSSYFLVVVSPNAVESHNVRNEINFALARKKPFLAVHLVQTSLPVGLELQMGRIQAVMRFRMSDESYRHTLCSVLPLSRHLSAEQEKQQQEEAELARHTLRCLDLDAAPKDAEMVPSDGLAPSRPTPTARPLSDDERQTQAHWDKVLARRDRRAHLEARGKTWWQFWKRRRDTSISSRAIHGKDTVRTTLTKVEAQLRDSR